MSTSDFAIQGLLPASDTDTLTFSALSFVFALPALKYVFDKLRAAIATAVNGLKASSTALAKADDAIDSLAKLAAENSHPRFALKLPAESVLTIGPHPDDQKAIKELLADCNADILRINNKLRDGLLAARKLQRARIAADVDKFYTGTLPAAVKSALEPHRNAFDKIKVRVPSAPRVDLDDTVDVAPVVTVDAFDEVVKVAVANAIANCRLAALASADKAAADKAARIEKALAFEKRKAAVDAAKDTLSNDDTVSAIIDKKLGALRAELTKTITTAVNTAANSALNGGAASTQSRSTRAKSKPRSASQSKPPSTPRGRSPSSASTKGSTTGKAGKNGKGSGRKPGTGSGPKKRGATVAFAQRSGKPGAKN